MTGWRLGWLVAAGGADRRRSRKLIEFNTSCAPVFVQRAGLAALAAGRRLVPALVARLRACRDTLLPRLPACRASTSRCPSGGMYAFFRVEGENDSLAFAKRLVREAGLGLAPGIAFGDEAEGWLRWCFASRDPGGWTRGVTGSAALRL